MRTRLILSAALILSVFAATAVGDDDPSLRGWWKLDDGAGATATDSSGRANDGTIFNLKGGLGQSGSVWDFDAERGIVASFSGDDSAGAYVSAGTVPALDLENELTWVFWAKQHVDQPNDIPGSGNDVMLGNRYGGTETPLQFVKFTPGKLEYYNDDPSYTMSIDYEKKLLTFEPNTYEPGNVMEMMMKRFTAPKSVRETPKVLAPAALLGIRVDKAAEDNEDGVCVEEVMPDSPAATAGFKKGDRLLTLDGRWTDTVIDCYVAAGMLRPGMTCNVQVKRDGKKMELKLTVRAGL